ncbi:hypothetical protein [Nocardia transvalensis]|uniref:hypothetical protein n=1 Tax=Nocardia transvalensis TaxID=37333 RepID=UPI001893331E|nr:hypothetical protein [Nocardia transvalensis]MBF6332155.1 hypothetical protein [Nocardia transvalensis]
MPMTTLQADLDHLSAMSKSLHALSGEAAGLNAVHGVPPSMLLPAPIFATLPSVAEASKMATGVQNSLIPTVSGRLREIGELMHAITVEFRKVEDANATMLAAAYLKGSGAWGRR